MERTITSVIKMNPGMLIPHPDNPRQDIGDIAELTESVKKEGVLQNLVIMPKENLKLSVEEQTDARKVNTNGKFVILIGHRRCAASVAAGLKEVRCVIVSNISRADQIKMMLEENMQRNDLTVIEQAQSFQLMLDLGETEESIADKTGFSRQTVRHRIQLARLDQEELKKKESDESFQLSLKDLYVLEKIDDINDRNKILHESTNSNQLSWKTSNYIRDKKRESNKANLIKLLEEKGVKKAPDSIVRNRWQSGIKEVKCYDLDKEEPHKAVVVPKGKKLYYLDSSLYYNPGSLIVVEKVPNSEKTP
ncbi:MAG: ParB/RepB/Spo0J family partition protein [Lachnospiraceae bacterium]|nr:ParB/RepB/Spo0J family partition protein [Lachnospiraceae bacterium]